MVSNHAGLGNDSPSSLQTQACTNIPSRVWLLMSIKMQNYSHCCSPKSFMYTHLFWDLFWNHSLYGKNLWVIYGGLGRWLGLPLFSPILHQPSLPMCTLFHHCSNLPLPSPSCLSVHLIPDTSPKHFLSTYEANLVLLSTCNMGVGTSWILMLPLTPKCWARHFNFHLLIVSLGG